MRFSLPKIPSWRLDLHELTPENGRWSNKDMDPVPTHLRTWTSWDYIAYWMSDATNIASWELASSMIAIGLSWRQALPAIAAGSTLIAIPTVLNGAIGSRLRVSFPVLARSSFGFWFSYVCVISRCVLSMFWFAIQTYTGSECVYQMLKALWPSITRFPNRLPTEGHITSAGLLSYFLFWTIQFPFLLVSPQKLKYLFVAKAVFVPITWLLILIWAMLRVPPSVSLGHDHSVLSGSALLWSYLSSFNSALGGWTPLTVCIADFTRFAKTEKAQLVQALVIPPMLTLVSFIGIVAASTGKVLYGAILWDPLKLVDQWDNRPAAFLASLSFMLATIGINIGVNSFGVANDLAAIFPRHVNFRRGQIVCAVIGGWILCPWEILATAPGLLSFLSGYTIVLSPCVAITISDYWLVHKGNVDVPAMYDPQGRYQYWHGINWRAAFALLAAIGIAMPGLIVNIAPSVRMGDIRHLYEVDGVVGFFVAGSVYWFLSVAFPAWETFINHPILDNTQGNQSIGLSYIISTESLSTKPYIRSEHCNIAKP